MLSLSDNIELFSSKAFRDGTLYKGEDAPAAFRNAISEYSESKKVLSLKLESIVEGEGSGILCTAIVNGRRSQNSSISVVFKNEKLVALLEWQYK